MATTRIMPLHAGKGRTVGKAISDIIDYVKNPDKTDHGRLITSYQCDSRVADAQFLLDKQTYAARTGRVRGKDDVIAYHLRQSFVPGEITPEEANRLGVELARRFTKGKHAFIVCTHIDKSHIHNHIIWYKFDIALIRGSYGDAEGNISMEQEPCYLEALQIAQAVHNCGGKVIVQVKYAAQNGSLDPKNVRIPGILVDAVVVCPEQVQTIEGEYNPALTGDLKIPADSIAPMKLDQRKVVARRAAMEMRPGMIMNLGFGMPDGVAKVAAEEGISDWAKMTIEQGIVGGIPASGAIFGVAYNAEAMLDSPSQFDFYNGGGLDMTCLGLAQADQSGNVNVSKFGSTIAGAGGFIDISQTAKKCVFCGTFTAGGLKTEIKDGQLHILQEGRNKKFLKQVEHITFSGEFAKETHQPVLYVTERAVFEMTAQGLVLKEIAPGVDLQKDILDQMDFVPLMPQTPKTMDARIFEDKPMGLKNT
nr:relaxase/mobilization nuclease domain-containing protein [Mediterraneibacter glycyrrhizinilyticus]